MAVLGTWPADIEAHPIDTTHAAAWAELRAAAEEVDQEGENYDADDLVEELEDPLLDAGQDTIGLWSGGAMVAFAVVRWRVNVRDVHRLNSEGTVHPAWRGRGIGTALLPWVVRRSGELHAEKHPEVVGEVGACIVSTNTDARDLLFSYGFEECRYFFTMHRTLDETLPDTTRPEGVRVVAFDPSYDKALLQAHTEAFRDHWGSTPPDEQRWQAWVTGSRGFRGEVCRLVLDGDRIVAYALGYEYGADNEAAGLRQVYVGQVGTLPSHRGRGLAGVALSELMTEAHRTGFEQASLDVDTASPTGALGLYERLGFVQANRSTAYRLPLD